MVEWGECVVGQVGGSDNVFLLELLSIIHTSAVHGLCYVWVYLLCVVSLSLSDQVLLWVACLLGVLRCVYVFLF